MICVAIILGCAVIMWLFKPVAGTNRGPQPEAMRPVEPVSSCPHGVETYIFNGVEASRNGGCGIYIDRPICVVMNGHNYFNDNVQGGICIKGDQVLLKPHQK
jgi:hypothetical protein